MKEYKWKKAHGVPMLYLQKRRFDWHKWCSLTVWNGFTELHKYSPVGAMADRREHWDRKETTFSTLDEAIKEAEKWIGETKIDKSQPLTFEGTSVVSITPTERT